MNRKTVAESMRRQGLRARAAKPFRHTNDSGYSLGVAPNLLAQDLTATRPDEKWAGDITYIRTFQVLALPRGDPRSVHTQGDRLGD